MDDAPPDADTLTIRFERPISFNGQTYGEATLREPTCSEWEEALAKGAGFAAIRHLFVIVGKMTPGAAAKVPVSKVVQADAFIGRFLRPGGEEAPVSAPQSPLPDDGAIWAAMVLREPTVDEMDRAGGGFRGTAQLVAYVTGLPLETTLRMPVSVWTRADAYFADFVRPSPA